MTVPGVMRSLRFRLLVAVGLLVVIAVTVVGLVSGRITTVEFHKFRQLALAGRDEPSFPDGIARQLSEYFGANGSWLGADRLLAASGSRHRPARAFILLDADDHCAAVSSPRLSDAVVVSRPDGRFHLSAGRSPGMEAAGIELIFSPDGLPLTDPNGRSIGTLYSLPALPGDDLSPADRFLFTVRRSQVAVVAGAGLLALLVTFLLARRIVSPVEALTAAARRMEQGDLEQRVRVAGDDEIGQLASAFNAMADGLQRTERLRRRMVTDVAHELRTPLTGLRCQIESIQDGVVKASPEVIASLHEDVLSLQRLVDDLQDVALVEAGQIRLEKRLIEPAVEIGAVIRSLPAAPARGGRQPGRAGIRTDLDRLPAFHADPHRFRQIVRNLLTNALTHTPPGGIIEVTGRSRNSLLEIAVRDEGQGIQPEHLPHIFERFYRADPSRQRMTGGAGLGLAIAKSLVEAHGGGIQVTSEPGRGATFTLTFPHDG